MLLKIGWMDTFEIWKKWVRIRYPLMLIWFTNEVGKDRQEWEGGGGYDYHDVGKQAIDLDVNHSYARIQIDNIEE